MGSGEWTDAHGRYAEKSELVAFARSRTKVTVTIIPIHHPKADQRPKT